uniref:RNA-binding protein Musashi isogeny 2 n=1 Tax=Cajanus cajan TaxID=3821 RepID=A0A151T148_CAJCA|nr:RNA-binding protein Musashi isogeny 2 [Cajanus cajan]
MDSDQGKLFIGGISWDTTEDKLKDHFGNYGDVLSTSVMREKNTGKPRGFGFVVFADPSILDRVLEDKHVIDGRTVDAKKAFSREDQQISVTSRTGNPNSGMNSGSGGNVRTKKIFVGGLPPTLTEEKFRQYFESYGHVTDVVVMYDQNTGRPRGFGFISFDTEEAVDRVLHKSFHDLNGKQVEVKRALPKDANPGASGRMMGGGGGGGGGIGGYQGYGASGGNQNAYDSRMDSSRYMQPQSAAGGFPPYGSSAYSAPGYGYGPANNGIGYGQSPGGAAGYGNQGYGYGGYGGYGGSDSSYGNSSAYGTVGGRTGSAPNSNASGPGGNELTSSGGSGSYMGAGYGDANGNSGYGNAAWRSEQTHASGNYGTPQGNGGQVGYGGGYGGAQSRQAQQQ